MRVYFRGRWPDEEVPAGEPVWLHYEVDPERDNVLRSVEIFPDGRSLRNSLELERRHGGAYVSLVHGPFLSLTAEARLEAIDATLFEALWRQAEDKPLV